MQDGILDMITCHIMTCSLRTHTVLKLEQGIVLSKTTEDEGHRLPWIHGYKQLRLLDGSSVSSAVLIYIV
jgi:hypothetical protein